MAASTRITYGEESIGGKLLAEGVDFIIKAQDRFERVKALADSVTAGGVTPANLESAVEFGAVTSGAALYDAIANMKVNVETVAASELAKLDKG